MDTTEKSVETTIDKSIEQKEAILPNVSINKFEAEIVLGGEKMIVKKLKAVKFYEAQKLFIEVMTGASKIERDKKEGKIGEDEANQKGIEFAWTVLPNLKIEFLSKCIDKTKEEIGELAYPKEIEQACEIIADLNEFDEILKKLLAPIQGNNGSEGASVQ